MKTFSKSTNRVGAIFLILGALLGAAAAPASATSGKASFDNAALELAPGDSATVALTLSQPVICAAANPCEATLDLSSAFPAGITVTPSILTFTSANWFTSQTVVIAVDQSAALDASAPIVSTAVFTGGSEFYLGYVPALSVTVPAPTSDVPAVAYSTGLAETGETPWFAIVGAILTASGAALALSARRIRK
jgi:hypothetical protein